MCEEVRNICNTQISAIHDPAMSVSSYCFRKHSPTGKNSQLRSSYISRKYDSWPVYSHSSFNIRCCRKKLRLNMTGELNQVWILIFLFIYSVQINVRYARCNETTIRPNVYGIKAKVCKTIDGFDTVMHPASHVPLLYDLDVVNQKWLLCYLFADHQRIIE